MVTNSLEGESTLSKRLFLLCQEGSTLKEVLRETGKSRNCFPHKGSRIEKKEEKRLGISKNRTESTTKSNQMSSQSRNNAFETFKCCIGVVWTSRTRWSRPQSKGMMFSYILLHHSLTERLGLETKYYNVTGPDRYHAPATHTKSNFTLAKFLVWDLSESK